MKRIKIKHISELVNIETIFRTKQLTSKQRRAGNTDGLIPIIDKEKKLIRFVKPKQ